MFFNFGTSKNQKHGTAATSLIVLLFRMIDLFTKNNENNISKLRAFILFFLQMEQGVRKQFSNDVVTLVSVFEAKNNSFNF